MLFKEITHNAFVKYTQLFLENLSPLILRLDVTSVFKCHVQFLREHE